MKLLFGFSAIYNITYLYNLRVAHIELNYVILIEILNFLIRLLKWISQRNLIYKLTVTLLVSSETAAFITLAK